MCTTEEYVVVRESMTEDVERLTVITHFILLVQYTMKLPILSLYSILCASALAVETSNFSLGLHVTNPLPDRLAIGYASWSECDDKITTAVEQGVNVVIWFAINLLTDDEGAPMITGGPNLTCVAEKKAEFAARGLDTTHLISIGGW